jgi:hypothetical protein
VVERPAFLDGKNAGLLAALVILPLLTAVVWLGPLRTAVQRLEAERLQHIDRAEKLEKRAGVLRPLSLEERAQLNNAFKALHTQTIQLGADAKPRVARELSRLFEMAGVGEAQLIVEAGRDGEETGAPRESFELAPLDGGAGFVLAPHRLRAQFRAGFSNLRRALDRLGDPMVPVRVDRLTLLREGLQVQADIELVYWSREEQL